MRQKNRCKVEMISKLLFGVLLVFVGSITCSTATDELCETAACKALSNQILGSIKDSVNPCDDFYQYACGSWIAKNPVPKGVLKWSHLSKTLDKGAQLRLGLLAEPISPNDPSAVKAAKNYYKTCLDEEHTDTIGLTPLLNIIQDNGGWPIIESSNFVPKKSWQEVHDEYISRMGDGALYTFVVLPVHRRAVNRSIILDQPQNITYLPIDYSDKSARTAYINFIEDIARLFAEASGSKITTAKVHRDARNLFKFQEAISKIKNPEHLRTAGPGMTIKAANSKIIGAANPGFDLVTSLRRAFGKVLGERVNLIKENRGIRIREMNYTRNLMKLLKQTPDDVIINYIHLHFVQHLIPYTTTRLKNLAYDLYKIDKTDRMTLCAKGPVLKRVLSYMYINRYFNAANRTFATYIIPDVRNSLAMSIHDSNWLNNEAKTFALEKLKKVVYRIGYDESFSNIDDINAVYAAYNIGNSHLQNFLNYKEAEYRREVMRLLKPIDWEKDADSFKKYPAAITPTFYLKYNMLEIPAGFLVSPFFSTDLPNHANLATVGATAGYLLGSLYDDLGWYFNEHGNLSLTLHKMLPVTKEHDERMKCFAEQYIDNAAKEVPSRKLQINSNQPVFFETVYDSFALKAIMDVYMNQIHPEGDRFLDTEKFSKENEFFLAFANPYCESMDPEAVPFFLEDGLHTISKLRVNLAVSNLPEFSEVYHCDKNAPMNPKRKCALL